MDKNISAASKAKMKYNVKAYDRLSIIVPKGKREPLKEFAKSKNMTLNEYVNYLLEKDSGIELIAK